MAKRLSPSDVLFLYSESRETMNHVASMLPFTPPTDAPPDWMRALVDEVREQRKLFPPWNLKLKTPDFLKNPVHYWVEDWSKLEPTLRPAPSVARLEHKCEQSNVDCVKDH